MFKTQIIQALEIQVGVKDSSISCFRGGNYGCTRKGQFKHLIEMNSIPSVDPFSRTPEINSSPQFWILLG